MTLTYSELNHACLKAVQDGNLGGVKYFVKKGADVHSTDYNYLPLASSYGRLEVVRYLVEDQGVDVNIDSSEALRWACQSGHIEVVQYLVEAGANIHADQDISLLRAIQEGHLEIVKYLVEHGANRYVKDDEALEWAKRWHQDAIAKYLVAVDLTTTVTTADDLAKLTVPSLKKLCKSYELRGYSKHTTKSALIQFILGHTTTTTKTKKVE
jgi:ankyrin repeat protein